MINLDGQCTNCAMKFISESQIFTSITVVDEMICSKTKDITILDAILRIYGFSALELAGVYLNDENEVESSGVNDLLETSDYIVKTGLSLCCSCVSVFKEVYVAPNQLKTLSTEAALLPKAIKKYSRSSVKVEVDPEGNDCNREIENPENDTNKCPKQKTNVVQLSKIPLEIKQISTVETEGTLSEEAFQQFHFDQIEEEYYEYEDVKVDPFQDIETTNEFITGDVVASSSAFPNVNFSSNDIDHSRICSSIYDIAMNVLPEHKKSQVPYSGRYMTRKTASLLSSVDTVPKYTENKTPVNGNSKTKGDSTEQRPTKMQLKLARIKRGKKIGFRKKKNIERPTFQEIEVYNKSAADSKLKNDNALIRYDLKTDAAKSSEASKDKEELEETEEYPEEERNDYYWDIVAPSYKKRNLAKVNLVEVKQAKLALTHKKMIKCSCGKYFSSYRGLRKHEDRHKSHESVMCDTCGQLFTKSHLLYRHKFLEHSQKDEISVDCQLCDARYLNNTSLRRHITEHHAENADLFVCYTCGSKFKSKYRLRVHAEIHKDEGLNKEFKCKECGVVMKHEYGLKKHVRIMHTYKKTFSCPECGKTTNNMTNMRIHMKVHDPNRILKRKPPNETKKKPQTKTKK